MPGVPGSLKTPSPDRVEQRRVVRTTAQRPPVGALTEDHPQHPQTVAHRPQIAGAVDAQVFVAGDLLHLQTGLDDPYVHQGLDLEAGAVEVDLVQAVPPEGVVAVAEVGVPRAELAVDHGAQHPVAEFADEGHVVGAAAVGEAGPFGEVRAGDQRGDVADDLVAVRRAVRVDHHDDVAGAGLEAGAQRVALALAALPDDLHAGPQSAGHLDGVVGGVAVDQDHFVDPVGKRLEDVRQVLRLVHGRDHHAHRRRDGQVRGDGPVLPGGRRILVRGRRLQYGAHESGPSRPVDRPPLGQPGCSSGSKGGFSLHGTTEGTAVHAG